MLGLWYTRKTNRGWSLMVVMVMVMVMAMVNVELITILRYISFDSRIGR
jgi:Tfp pilus assembly protein PilX